MTKYYTEEEGEERNSMEPSAKLYDTSYYSSVQVGEIEDVEVRAIDKKGEEDEKQLTRMERFKVTLTYLRPMAIMLFFDAALPLAIYYILKIWLSVLIALLLSGIPPLLRVFYVFWKKRQIDILGCIFVLSFIISAVLSIVSGDVRLTLLRDSTTTAIISLMFFITLIPIHTRWFRVRPLIFMFAQQMMSESPPVTWTDINGKEHSQERIEWIWEHCKLFRQYCYILCTIWGTLLMSEFIAKVIMIKSTLTVDQIILIGNIIVIVVVVSMTIGTMFASRFVRKRTVIILKDWLKRNDYSS